MSAGRPNYRTLRQPFGPAEEASLCAQFAAAFSSDMRVKVVRVKSLPRTTSGKFRYVESKVAEAFLERLMDPTHSEGASSR